LRLFKDIFREVEAFDYKCEAFIKVTRLFEGIFNGNEAFFQSDLRLFLIFSRKMEAFVLNVERL
jgi:hypothetical protein